MFVLSVDTGPLVSRMDAIARQQVPFATAVTLTNLAKAVHVERQRQMMRVFDRPTQFTLNAFMVVPATKATQRAEVRLKPTAGKRHYLPVEEEGGARPKTGIEQKVGGLAGVSLASLIPAKGAIRDAHGNWSQSQMSRVIADLRSGDPVAVRRGDYSAVRFKDGKAIAGKRRLGRRATYFIPRGEGMPKGIYQRKGRKTELVAAFAGKPSYSPRLDFKALDLRTVRAWATPYFKRALADALTTAR